MGEKDIGYAEAAKILHRSIPTIRKFTRLKENPIPHRKLGGRFYFRESEIIDWYENKCKRG